MRRTVYKFNCVLNEEAQAAQISLGALRVHLDVGSTTWGVRDGADFVLPGAKTFYAGTSEVMKSIISKGMGL